MILSDVLNLNKQVLINEGKGHYLTGEKNITVSLSNLLDRLIALDPNFEDTFRDECSILISNQVINFNNENEVIIYDWDLLISQLDNFAIVARIDQNNY